MAHWLVTGRMEPLSFPLNCCFSVKLWWAGTQTQNAKMQDTRLWIWLCWVLLILWCSCVIVMPLLTVWKLRKINLLWKKKKNRSSLMTTHGCRGRCCSSQLHCVALICTIHQVTTGFRWGVITTDKGCVGKRCCDDKGWYWPSFTQSWQLAALWLSSVWAQACVWSTSPHSVSRAVMDSSGSSHQENSSELYWWNVCFQPCCVETDKMCMFLYISVWMSVFVCSDKLLMFSWLPQRGTDWQVSHWAEPEGTVVRPQIWQTQTSRKILAWGNWQDSGANSSSISSIRGGGAAVVTVVAAGIVGVLVVVRQVYLFVKGNSE